VTSTNAGNTKNPALLRDQRPIDASHFTAEISQQPWLNNLSYLSYKPEEGWGRDLGDEIITLMAG